jgi:uncharacterized protein with ATP-grasp and redox domains
MTENNLEHTLNPDINASPEHLRFMVSLDEDQVFAPCSDQELKQLLRSRMSPELQEAYNRQWRRLALFVHDNVKDRYLWRRIIALCRHKYRMVLSSPFIIPGRLMKRFLNIFLTQTSIDDPLREEKRRSNKLATASLGSETVQDILYACPEDIATCGSIQDMRWQLNLEELIRTLCLSTWPEFWEKEPENYAGRSREEVLNFSPEVPEILTRNFCPENQGAQKVLFIPDTSGGICFDLLMIRALLRQGHKVIVALKEGFYFQAPTLWDLEADQVLAEGFNGAHVITESQLSKNELLNRQRANPFMVISDGTRERLNLYRTSVTFARAWKESDIILAKGRDNHRQLILNSHEFTRDILCCCRDQDGRLQLDAKPKAKRVVKFTEMQLQAKAEAIIQELRHAKADGQKVMFYSAIIGSIPGQTRMAISILNAFVSHLRDKLSNTTIINPAEHFESGMDGDDLMYMWEIVQRSGLIDVWRFQSVEDIETAFDLLDMRMPPVWVGKDATYSTGCTKEMNIALDLQKRYPELQIIGPDPEKFFRRREYGVGKFFDAGIERA